MTRGHFYCHQMQYFSCSSTAVRGSIGAGRYSVSSVLVFARKLNFMEEDIVLLVLLDCVVYSVHMWFDGKGQFTGKRGLANVMLVLIMI